MALVSVIFGLTLFGLEATTTAIDHARNVLQPRSDADLCAILDGRAAIVGSHLYFMSANYTFNNGTTSHTAPYLYWIDLNTTVDVSGYISPSILHSVASPSDELLGMTDAAGAFFYDHEMLYAYAGIVTPKDEQSGFNNTMWAFNTSTNTWALDTIRGGSLQFGNNSEGESVSIPATEQSFYTGGFGIGVNDTFSGIVAFSAGEDPNWTFETKETTGLDSPNILKGGMVYVRKGQAGVLVAFGGSNTTGTGTQFALGGGWPWDYYDMSLIFVYDIESNSWFNLTATGDVPGQRGEFCTVVSSAPDDSSFQITMYGGWSQFYGVSYDDVYVLTVPGFRWIKIADQNNTDTSVESDVGRNRMKCTVWNEGQMIVVGGGISKDLNINKCNPTYTPLRVLDTSSYIWQAQFNPYKNYTVPSAVHAVIGGSETGGATVTSPSGGWPNTALESIFRITVPRDNYNPLSSSAVAQPSTSTSAAGTSSPASSQGLSGGDIAGIVVGVVVGIALLVAGCLIIYKRISRRRGQTTPPYSAEHKEWDKPELPPNEARHHFGDEPQMLDSQQPPQELPGGNEFHELHPWALRGELDAQGRPLPGAAEVG